MNKSRKKGINQHEKAKDKLINYKDLERNILYEISNEISDSKDKKSPNKNN